MKIGIAGPATLRMLCGLESAAELPLGYDNPGISLLVNALLQKGHEVALFTTSVEIDSPAVLSAGNLTVCVAQRSSHAARDLFRSERRELLRLMRRVPVDVMNAHWSYEFAWAALCSGTPTLVTIRDRASAVFAHHRDMYRLVRLLINQYVLNRARHLSVNSEYLYAVLPRRHQRKAKVIPNFIGPEIVTNFNHYTRRERAIVSVVNGFGKLKNVATALQAFTLLRRSWPDLRYQLIGVDMGPTGSAAEFATDHHLTEGVDFMGKLSHEAVLSHVRNAKVLLHPSLEESFGMSVLEAMALGTPVVGGYQSGNIPALLNWGGNGVLCDVSRPEAIADALSTILSQPEWAQERAKVAASDVRRRFMKDEIVSAYLAYYQSIIDEYALGYQ